MFQPFLLETAPRHLISAWSVLNHLGNKFTLSRFTLMESSSSFTCGFYWYEGKLICHCGV